MNRLDAALEAHTPPCRQDPDAMFVDGADQNRAKFVCRRCPLIIDCAAHALERGINRGEWGVWGGMTERDRRALLRKRPDVRDWGTELRRVQNEQDEAARAA